MNEQDSGALAIAAAIDAASVDPQRWPDAMSEIANFLEAEFAALVYEDRASTLLELRYSTRARRDWIAEYLRNHRKLDAARARALSEVGVGRAFSARDFLPDQRFHRSAIFQRWMEPHGLVDVLGAVLHRSAAGVCIFVALRGRKAGPANAEAKARLTALLPALARAAIGEGRGRSLGQGFHLADVFDHLASPVLVVDAQMRVLQSNRSGREMLERHPALALSGGGLVVNDPLARDALERALRPEEPLGAESFAIMLNSGDERCCVMHVLPLPKGGAALFVRSLAPRADNGGAVVAELYGLTARERSVLLAITEVGGVPATARALGLSEGTVKGYLKSIFQKTGAERQADLVKLVLALESPFRKPALEEMPA